MAVGGLAEVRAMLTAEGGQRKREAELLSSANSKLSKLADLATQLVSAGAQVAEEENNTSNAAAAAAAASAGCMQRFPEGSPPAVSKKQAFFYKLNCPLAGDFKVGNTWADTQWQRMYFLFSPLNRRQLVPVLYICCKETVQL